VLFVHGSPRKGGNTDALAARLEALLAGASVRSEHLRCAEVSVKPCTGCGACGRTGECVLTGDDMPRVYEAVDRADALVVASPVYFLGPPAPLKALIDRFQPYWSRIHLLGQPPPRERVAVVLSTAGAPSHSVFTCLHRILDAWFEVLGVRAAANLFLEGVDEAGSAERDPRVESDLPVVAKRLRAHLGPEAP
ncbi:MAG: flavodoxin family protein, partial [Candidatus Dadabacteria bacterium]